jgi:endonuclease/exonuclease/phosphatase family metal-dependent hydrolase
VHLALSKAARGKQLEHLAELLPANAPFIVAGDFNTYHGEQELADFMANHGLRNANTAGLPTYPSWNPKKQLDYILYSKEITLENFSVPRVDFSDHLPLVMDFLI